MRMSMSAGLPGEETSKAQARRCCLGSAPAAAKSILFRRCFAPISHLFPSLPPATGDARVKVGSLFRGHGASAHPTCSQHPCLGHAAVAGAMVMMG